MSGLLQVELTIPAGALTNVAEALEELGAQSVTLGDPGGEPVLEPNPGDTPLWPEVVVTALLPANVARADVQDRLARVPHAAPSSGVTFTILEDRNWLREFRESLAPLRFGERLWICPAGISCPDPAGIAVTLEPGLAFGSGAHPSTALCLRWLAGLDPSGRSLLDWGCGSGVLAIAALALGARAATAVDIDPQALEATRDNAQRNGFAGELRASHPAKVMSTTHDIVVANILADTLIAAAPVLRRHCNTGADVALSGILAAQAQRVRDACAPYLDLRLAAELDGWVLLTGTACTPVARAAAPRFA